MDPCHYLIAYPHLELRFFDSETNSIYNKEGEAFMCYVEPVIDDDKKIKQFKFCELPDTFVRLYNVLDNYILRLDESKHQNLCGRKAIPIYSNHEWNELYLVTISRNSLQILKEMWEIELDNRDRLNESKSSTHEMSPYTFVFDVVGNVRRFF